MKKLILLLSLSIISIIGNAQNAGDEKNITGAQIGLFGLDIYNETKIARQLTLRADLSIFPAIWGGNLYAKTGFVFYPALTVQPRYYYNLIKRAESKKNTKNNAANYLSLQLRYIPDWFVISNTKNLSLSNQVNLIPTFGIRRNFSGNFNYEIKGGLGYGTIFGNEHNTSGAVLDIGIKVGYDF